MTIRFLLDTNIVSEPLRPKPNGGIVDRLRQHQSELAIAAVVWHELRYGCVRMPESARRSAIERYLTEVVATTMPILPYDEIAADWHAQERARLIAAGQTPAFVDGQIAATAVTNDLTLVTLDASGFGGFAGLTVTNWAV